MMQCCNKMPIFDKLDNPPSKPSSLELIASGVKSRFNLLRYLVDVVVKHKTQQGVCINTMTQLSSGLHANERNQTIVLAAIED